MRDQICEICDCVIFDAHTGPQPCLCEVPEEPPEARYCVVCGCVDDTNRDICTYCEHDIALTPRL